MTNLPARATRAAPLAHPALPSRSFANFLYQIADHASGAVELRRELTGTERQTLQRRQRELLPFLAGTPSAKIRNTIARSFAGFGFAPGIEEAQVIAVQYITVLEGKPLWAIEKACMRFARGEVAANEVKTKFLDSNNRPTTAQMSIIVEEIVEPFATEAQRIQKVLAAPVGRPPETAEDRAEGNKKIEKWRARQGVPAEEKPSAAEHREAAERADVLHRARVLKEYTAAGLDPPEERPGKMLCTLALLLQMGWRIEDGPAGKKVLTAPPTPKPRRQDLNCSRLLVALVVHQAQALGRMFASTAAHRTSFHNRVSLSSTLAWIKALGNAMNVAELRWIFGRIDRFEREVAQ